MLHRIRNSSSQRADRHFRAKFQQNKQSPLRDLCKYILAVSIFFLLMYIFMHIVSSIPLGSDISRQSATETNTITNKQEADHNKVIAQPNKAENTKHPRNDYIIFPNFMAPQIGGISKGLFEKFESRHEHNLVQLYCDSLRDQCIGYAFNKNGGYQFYSPRAWPMQKKKGWDFYMKHDPNTELSLGHGTKGLLWENMGEDSKKKYANTQPDKLATDTHIKNKTDIDSTKVEIEQHRKYISYAQNVGRVNNQMVSFEAMIQYAMYYNRTLVIPWPRHRNHVMGFECGFWDFNRLGEVIDIVMEDELPQSLQNYRDKDSMPKECRFIKLVGMGIPDKLNRECEMIYLYEGDMGIFHFRDGPKDVMKYIIPAKYIRNAVEDFLKDKFGELRYRVGVHRRAMSEGGKDPKTGEIHVCRWETRGIHGDSRFAWLRNAIKKVTGSDEETYEKIIAIYHHSCAMDFDDLQNILTFHKQEVITNNETFFIAHDHQEQSVINEMKTYGGIEQPNGNKKEKHSSHFWSQSEKCYKYHRTKCMRYGHCSTQSTLRMKEEILYDMWALYYADFLAGTWMSTLTRTICHWKGFEYSLYNGNQCFLKWKWEDTVNGKHTDWYTLDGLNTTALFD